MRNLWLSLLIVLTGLVLILTRETAPETLSPQADPDTVAADTPADESLIEPESTEVERERISEGSGEVAVDQEPPVEEPIRYPGPDPVEVGECSLLMNFYDADSGEPVSGFLDLWRIDAPGNDSWSAGDQKQKDSLMVKEGQVQVDLLPAGRYRAYPLFGRAGTEVAPAFDISGQMTVISLAVVVPKFERVALHLVDESGVPLPESMLAKLEFKDRGYKMDMGARTPDWKTSRHAKNSNVIMGFGAGGGYRGASHRSWKPAKLVEGAVDLGLIQEDTLEWRKTQRFGFRFDGGPHTTVEFETTGAGIYVAVLPNREAIRDRLQFPADVTWVDLTADLWLTVYGVSIDSGAGQTLASRWLGSVVHLRLSVNAFNNVSVKWAPGKETMPDTALTSRSSK
ncbi:MAG: hypothetical protein P1V35_04630 [Planctomycetota bacterium]|nr:hypothetical protein [Planctomycetota bacterium]